MKPPRAACPVPGEAKLAGALGCWGGELVQVGALPAEALAPQSCGARQGAGNPLRHQAPWPECPGGVHLTGPVTPQVGLWGPS